MMVDETEDEVDDEGDEDDEDVEDDEVDDDDDTTNGNAKGDNENASVKSTVDEGTSELLSHDANKGINTEGENNFSKNIRGSSPKSKNHRSGNDHSKSSTKDRRHHGNDGDSTVSNNTKSGKVKTNNQLKKSTDLLSLFSSKKNKKTLEKLIEHFKNCNYDDDDDGGENGENSKIDVNLLTNIFKLVSAIDSYELKLMNGVEGLDISSNINKESISLTVDTLSKKATKRSSSPHNLY
ncbi:unnamed protein product [[Candida] boidinii]|nr:unnamed protein product [[Candida] boidinii]